MRFTWIAAESKMQPERLVQAMHNIVHTGYQVHINSCRGIIGYYSNGVQQGGEQWNISDSYYGRKPNSSSSSYVLFSVGCLFSF